jgi:hypothetical protein
VHFWSSGKADMKQEAARAYTAALRLPDLTKSEQIALLLNRGVAYQGFGRYGPALQDYFTVDNLGQVGDTILTEAQNSKLALRKLQVVYKLRLWETTRAYLTACESIPSIVDKLSIYRKGLVIRERELKGNFDWNTVHDRCATTSTNAELDIADYHGPIEVRTTLNNGRGLFVTRDVAAGEPLLVERALVTSSGTGDPRLSLGQLKPDGNGTNHFQVCSGIASRAVHAILDDPSSLPLFDSQYPGETRFSPDITEQERLDILRDTSTYGGAIDVDKLAISIGMNGFGNPYSSEHLFAFQSMINHSCGISNVTIAGIDGVGKVCSPLYGHCYSRS